MRLNRRRKPRGLFQGIAHLSDDAYPGDSPSSPVTQPGSTFTPVLPPISITAPYTPSIPVVRPGTPYPTFTPGPSAPTYTTPTGPAAIVPGYNPYLPQAPAAPGITIPGYAPPPGAPTPNYSVGPSTLIPGSSLVQCPNGTVATSAANCSPGGSAAPGPDGYNMPFSPELQAILDANASATPVNGPARPAKPVRTPVYRPARPAPARPVRPAKPVRIPYSPPVFTPKYVPPTPAYIPSISIPTTYAPVNIPTTFEPSAPVNIPTTFAPAPPTPISRPLPQLPTIQFNPPVYQPQGDKQPNITHVDDSTLPSVVSSGVTFVFFHGPNCGPCNSMIPAIEQLARNNAGRANVVDYFVTDGNRQQYSKYSDLGYPSYVVFKDGVPVNTVVGSITQTAHVGRMSAAQLQSQIDQAGTPARGPAQPTYVAPTLPVITLPPPPPPPQPTYTGGPTNVGSGCQHVTDSTFASMNGPGITTIVVFHARWCPHCPDYVKYADRVANEYRVNGVMNGNIRILEADVDQSPQLAAGVNSVPSTRVYQNGVQVSEEQLYNFNKEYPPGSTVPSLASGTSYVPSAPVPEPPSAPTTVYAQAASPSGYTYVILDKKPAYQNRATGHVISEAEYLKLTAPKTGTVAAGKMKSEITASIKNADSEVASIGSILDKVNSYGQSAASKIWDASQSKPIVAAPFVSSGSGATSWPTRPAQPRPVPQIPSQPIQIATRPGVSPEFQSASQTTPMSATAASLDAVSASGEAFAANILGNQRTNGPMYPDQPLTATPSFATNAGVTLGLKNRAATLREQIAALQKKESDLSKITDYDSVIAQVIGNSFALPNGPVGHDAVYNALQKMKTNLTAQFTTLLRGSGLDMSDPAINQARSQVMSKWIPILTDFAIRANGDVDNPLREFAESGANASTDRDGYNYAQNEARARFADQQTVLTQYAAQAIAEFNQALNNRRAELQSQEAVLMSQLQSINAQLPQTPVLPQKSWVDAGLDLFGVNR